MNIELLTVPGCASHKPVLEMLHELAEELSPGASIQERLIKTLDEAQGSRFPGSPTVRINGRDLEPEAEASLNFGLG